MGLYPSDQTTLASADGNIVDGEAILTIITTLSDYQGKGLAGSLLALFIEKVAEEGANRLSFTTHRPELLHLLAKHLGKENIVCTIPYQNQKLNFHEAVAYLENRKDVLRIQALIV